MVPAAVCVFVAHQSGEAWGSDRLLRWESLRVAESASAARGCHTSAPISWGECTWNDDGRQSVVLLGDSHASALSDAMIESASAMDYRVVVRSASNCPFLADGFQWTTNGDQGHIRACREFVERQLTSLRSDPPDVLVIANRATNRTNPPVLTDQETPLAVCPVFARGEICPSQAELGRAWAQSLEKTLDLISALGTRVLIVHTVPDHRVHLGSCSFTTGLDVDCTRTEREFVDTRRGGVVALEREVVARFAPAASWDAAPAFCDDGWCERRVDGAPAYRDEQHLSPHGARLLQPDLGEAVTALLRRD